MSISIYVPLIAELFQNWANTDQTLQHPLKLDMDTEIILFTVEM